jgi:DNA-binding NarL/FixJ family response regulator
MPHHRRRGRPPHDDVLTPAEWKVTHAVQHGMSNRTIAERSGVSGNGVKFHIANVLGKLGLPDRKALRHWFQAPKDSALAQRQASVTFRISKRRTRPSAAGELNSRMRRT